jgi:NAD(P)-dependent dehydrogenase (short-subunit alcohol dehydrogenase family)
MPQPQNLFQIQGQTAVITGGSGVLGKAMSSALAHAGVRVAILSLHEESSGAVAAELRADGAQAMGLACDTTDRASLERALSEITRTFGPIDILINGAGGNRPQATTSMERSFFDLDSQAASDVLALNFTGTLLSCQVFGRAMAQRGRGCIVNITSMSGLRPLTRVPVYSAAKAAIVNFTQWLAVHIAQEYSTQIRVNAIAPGFFLTEQNRYLMLNEDGTLTSRAQTILSHTPANRFGTPEELVGTLLWLVSPASAFVNGIVVPVDGGFSAFGGV